MTARQGKIEALISLADVAQSRKNNSAYAAKVGRGYEEIERRLRNQAQFLQAAEKRIRAKRIAKQK